MTTSIWKALRGPALTVLSTLATLAAPPAAAQTNLLANGSFETGTTQGWFTTGTPSFDATGADSQTGTLSGFVSRRLASWQGPAIDLRPYVLPDHGYRVSFWVRPLDTLDQTVKLTLFRQQGAGTWTELDRVHLDAFEWRWISGVFSVEPGTPPEALYVYLEGPAAGVDFFVDEATLVELPHWRVDSDERIERLRKRTARITVLDGAGAPAPGVAVDIQQDRHRFGFGSAIRRDVLSNATYRNFFLEHFEWAVPENEVKWWYTERNQGAVSYADADAMIDLCRQNRIPVRGHNLFWATPQGNPDWLLSLPNPFFQLATEARLNDAVSRFRGRLTHWDVNNEMLHGSVFVDRLGGGVRTWMFKETNRIDPDAELFVNDYDVVAGERTREFVDQIGDLMIAGAPIHGIGVQGHFYDVDPYLVRQRLDILLRPDLPIWITELDVTDPNDAQRADKLERAYRTAFGHQGVEGVVLWGFWEGAHWRPDAAIVDRDWRLNEAGERFLALMDEWTTERSGTTDANGGLNFRGFHGLYTVTLTAPGRGPETHVVQLEPGTSLRQVTLQLGTGE